jgi:hypothetical protein
VRGSSSAGLLLLLVAFVGIAGFLTGNLDRWLDALFSPTPTTAPPATPTGARSVGGSTQRQVA